MPRSSEIRALKFAEENRHAIFGPKMKTYFTIRYK